MIADYFQLLGKEQFTQQYQLKLVCSYSQLQTHFLTLELYQGVKFCGAEKYKGHTHISLRQLASASTKQRTSFIVELPGGRNQVTGKLEFRCRFEEILTFRLQLDKWQGLSIDVNNSAAFEDNDPSLYPYRHLVFRVGNNPPSPPLVCANPDFPRWNGPVVVTFEGSSVDLFRNSLLMAILYASSSEDSPQVPIGYAAIPFISITEVPFVRAPVG
jgi:hypothetical protein